MFNQIENFLELKSLFRQLVVVKSLQMTDS